MTSPTPRTVRLLGGLALVLAGSGVLSAVHVRRAVSATEWVGPSAAARPAAAETCQALVRWNRALLDVATTSEAAVSHPTGLVGNKTRVVSIVTDVERATADLVHHLDAIRANYQTVAGVPEIVGLIQDGMSRSEQTLQAAVAEANALPVDNQADFDRAKQLVRDRVNAAGTAWSPSDLDVPHLAKAASVMATFEDEPGCAPIFHP